MAREKFSERAASIGAVPVATEEGSRFDRLTGEGVAGVSRFQVSLA
jgi:hypothetical protein